MKSFSSSLRLVSMLVIFCSLVFLQNTYAASCSGHQGLIGGNFFVCDAVSGPNQKLQTPQCSSTTSITGLVQSNGFKDPKKIGNSYTATSSSNANSGTTLIAMCACKGSLQGPNSSGDCSCPSGTEKVGNNCLAPCTSTQMRDGAGVCRPKCLDLVPPFTNASRIANEKDYYTGSTPVYKTILGIRDPGTPTQCEHKCDIGYKPSLDRKSCELVLCPVDTYYCPATDSNPANTVRDCIAKGAICGDGGRRASGNYCNDTDAVCDIHEGPGCADCDGVVGPPAHCQAGLTAKYDASGTGANTYNNSSCVAAPIVCDPRTHDNILTPESPVCIATFSALTGTKTSIVLKGYGLNLQPSGSQYCGINTSNLIPVIPTPAPPAITPTSMVVWGDEIFNATATTKAIAYFRTNPTAAGSVLDTSSLLIPRYCSVTATGVVCGRFPAGVSTFPTVPPIAPTYTCIPKLKCQEGTYYCATSKACIVTETPCGDGTTGPGGHACFANGICDKTEGCGCPDCHAVANTNPLTQDHCAAGLFCKKGITSPNQAECINPNCTQTEAPSEIQVNRDQPYIGCRGGVATDTHFKYRITPVSPTTGTVYNSPAYLKSGGPILHTTPTLPIGSYRVECFYGASETTVTNTPDICTKNMEVKALPTTGIIPGCKTILGYKGSQPNPTTELNSSISFNASFACESQTSMVTTPAMVEPFRIQIAEVVIPSVPNAFTEYLNSLGLSTNLPSVSIQTPSQAITGRVKASCAVKVGGGYSTSNACTINACAGANCDPDTFDIAPSVNNRCVNTLTASYDIGCKPSSIDYPTCTAKFDTIKSQLSVTTPSKTFKMNYQQGNTPVTPPSDNVTCTLITPPLPATTPIMDCKVILPTGNNVSIYTSDFSATNANSYQTINDVATTDSTPPTATGPTVVVAGPIPDITKWISTPGLSLEVGCQNETENGDACTCAPSVYATATPFDVLADWTTLPASSLRDTNAYRRMFSAEGKTLASTLQIWDAAGNKSRSPFITIPIIGIDRTAPVVAVTDIAGTGTTRTITLSAADSLSGIWTTTQSSGETIFVQTGPKATIPFYNTQCGVTIPNYISLSTPPTPTATRMISNIDLTTQSISYCVRDNAGNTTRGKYPTVPAAGCFSDSRNLVTLASYEAPLIARLNKFVADSSKPSQTDDEKLIDKSAGFGYEWTKNPTAASCMQTILTGNITTLVKNKFDSSLGTTLDWGAPANLKGATSIPNTEGYYYFVGPTNIPNGSTDLTIPAFDFTNESPRKQRVIVVENRNARITGNIISPEKPVIIIVKGKTQTGLVAGDVLVSTIVTQLDAIIIADGSLRNIDLSNLSSPIYPDWVGGTAFKLNNRLVINGRLYSGNARGGSLKVVSGVLNKQDKNISSDEVIYFDVTKRKLDKDGSSNLFETARQQDLERFRMVFNDNGLCSLIVNYKSYTPSTLPPILQKPASSSCAGNF